MGVGLSGMISGLDTDAIVKAMVSGQQAKATKVENKITLNKWTKEAWSGLNTKIYSFYTKYASKLRLQTSYMTRTASSSNESVAKATAGSGAAVGTHSLQVKKLASSQYVTGAQLKAKEKDAQGNLVDTDKKANYNKNSKLVDDLGVAKGTIITIKGQLGTEDEEVVKIEVNETTTINDFLTACKDAGLTASFDTNQQRFFISSSESGMDDKFSITTSKLSETANTTFSDIDKLITKEYMTSDEKKAYDEAINTLRINTGIISEVLSGTYDTTNATYKAVKSAIDTVEKFAVEHAAETEAVKRAELIKYPDNSEQIKSIDDVISSIFSSIPEKADTNTTTKEFVFYDKEYSMKSLAELKEKATNAVETRAKTAANSAIKGLKLEPVKTDTGIVLNELTKEKYDKAIENLKNIADAQAEFDNAKANEDAAVTDADKQEARQKVVAAEEKLITAKKSEEESTNIRNAWESTELKGTYADGTSLDTGLTLEKLYKQEYEKIANVVNDNGTPEDLTDDTVDTTKRIQEELKNLIISENQTKYDAKVSEIKNKILTNLTLEPGDEGYSTEYTDIVNEINGTQGIKDNIKTSLGKLSSAEDDSFSGATALSGMGLGNINGDAQYGTVDGTENGTPANKMVVVAASDAEFVLDGATMTETSNSFTVNGLTLNLSGTTKNDSVPGGYDTVQITVGKDVDSTYKLVKEAITEYNKLLEEMNTAYNADSARGYEPLTDEQKEAMTETDIENWEKKIKDSLLRRDDTLGTLLTSMRNALSSSYTDEDGKTYSLSMYGIVTGNYTEKGKLHIYGDEDDGTYATYNDRLKAALDEDPDKVMETLTHIFGNLYSTMTEKCAKTEISSALTFYNDKQYNNLLKDYEDDLDILEDRIKELEDRYYKQFTAMEKAMSTLQNQSNSLASLLGTGQ